MSVHLLLKTDAYVLIRYYSHGMNYCCYCGHSSKERCAQEHCAQEHCAQTDSSWEHYALGRYAWWSPCERHSVVATCSVSNASHCYYYCYFDSA